LVRRVVSETLDRSKEIEVVGGAANGQQALEKIPTLKPDTILLDVEMPVMDGLETLRQMREQRIELPVVMFSSRTERGAKIATEALLLGARDFVFKPGGTEMSDLSKGRQAIQDEAIPKLIAVTRKGSPRFSPPRRSDRPLNRVDLAVVGASTGGPAAIAKILQTPGLAQSLHAPILIVQHMPEHFTAHLASRLKQETSLDIAEAEEGEVLLPGMIRIAPGGVRHTCVNGSSRKLTVFLREDPPVNSCRPSVDVLFRSAAECIGANTLSVILTGMGQDGVNGCRKIVEAGGHVLAQDEASSIVWGMPGNVVAQHLADKVVPLDLLGAEISRRLNHGR
jgi:two-component system chemotaxis response regulator CheB